MGLGWGGRSREGRQTLKCCLNKGLKLDLYLILYKNQLKTDQQLHYKTRNKPRLVVTSVSPELGRSKQELVSLGYLRSRR